MGGSVLDYQLIVEVFFIRPTHRTERAFFVNFCSCLGSLSLFLWLFVVFFNDDILLLFMKPLSL